MMKTDKEFESMTKKAKDKMKGSKTSIYKKHNEVNENNSNISYKHTDEYLEQIKSEDPKISEQGMSNLIEAFQPLVQSQITSKFERFYQHGLSRKDIEQAANEGIIKAIEKYDPTKGASFSSYSVNWIRKYILDEINQNSSTIRVPEKIRYQARRIQRLKDASLGKNQGIDENRIQNQANISSKKYNELNNIYQNTLNPTSIDKPVDDEGTTILGSFMTADSGSKHNVETHFKRADIFKAMKACLNPREIQILIALYGFDNNNRKTLEEIGKDYDITKERVRQISKRACEKLKSKLIDYSQSH